MSWKRRIAGALIWLLCAISPLCAAMRVVDIHVHLIDTNPSDFPPFLRKLQALGQSLDYTACVLTPYSDRLVVAEAAKKYPRLVVPIGYVEMDDPSVLEKIEEFHRLGYRGLGELEAPHKAYNDPSYFPIYELADRYHWVVLFHTGIDERDHFDTPENNASFRMHAYYLDEIARRFPHLIAIGAHCGNPEYTWAAEVARWNPNVFFDLSGSTLLKFRGRLAEFRNIFWWSGTNEGTKQPGNNPSAFTKLVFGSDALYLSPTNDTLGGISHVVDEYRAVFSACDVPADAQKLVLGGTLDQVLGIPPARE